jgi:hypothetical protein
MSAILVGTLIEIDNLCWLEFSVMFVKILFGRFAWIELLKCYFGDLFIAYALEIRKLVI